MEKFPLALKNILKILIWIGFIFTFIELFGMIYGTILYILLVLLWSLALTATREFLHAGDSNLKLILKTIFTTSPTLPLTAYGCYCSPRYGLDGRTNGLDPVDGLDNDCKKHDDDMIIANEAFANGALTKSDYIKLKNKGDWRFMKRAIVSENSASGIYLLFLEIGFLFRLIGRNFL